MDALDRLNRWVKVRGMINLVLDQVAGNLVPDELLWLDYIVISIKVVLLQTPGDDGKYQVTPFLSANYGCLVDLDHSPSFHVLISADMPPHLDGKGMHHILRTRFLVLVTSVWNITPWQFDILCHLQKRTTHEP